MKARIEPSQLLALSEQAQSRLADWFASFEEPDRDMYLAFIPEEMPGEFDGLFEGARDDEHEFTHPQHYIGKLHRHQGTVLPVMDVTMLWQYLDEHGQLHPQQTVDELWAAVAGILETDQ